MENGKTDRLEQLMASYGADKARWPVGDRSLAVPESRAEEARAIDALLGLASDPALPDGAMGRLMARIEQEVTADVIQFRPKASRRPGFMRYAAALPLAASLALGVYLGAMGSLDAVLPVALTGDVATSDDLPDDLGGVGEADAYAEENFS